MLKFYNNSKLFYFYEYYRTFGTNLFVTYLKTQNLLCMKQYFSLKNIVFALAITVFIIGFSAFSQKQKDDKSTFRKGELPKDIDTAASGRHNRSGDNWNMDLLDEQMKQLDTQMRNLDNQMKHLDIEKYQIGADEAMKNIDAEKITAEIDKAMKEIDWEKINDEIEENTSNVSRRKMQEMQQQMEKAKANLQKQKFNMQIDVQKMRANIDKSLQDARKSLERAKQELKNMKEFTGALEKDGLLDKSKPYKIEVRNGELYLNNKKQTKETSDKYRHYYPKSDFKIDTGDGDSGWL